jgi:hypothetical protein
MWYLGFPRCILVSFVVFWLPSLHFISKHGMLVSPCDVLISFAAFCFCRGILFQSVARRPDSLQFGFPTWCVGVPCDTLILPTFNEGVQVVGLVHTYIHTYIHTQIHAHRVFYYKVCFCLHFVFPWRQAPSLLPTQSPNVCNSKRHLEPPGLRCLQFCAGSSASRIQTLHFQIGS